MLTRAGFLDTAGVELNRTLLEHQAWGKDAAECALGAILQCGRSL